MKSKFEETKEWQKDGYKLIITNGKNIKISVTRDARYGSSNVRSVSLRSDIALEFAKLILNYVGEEQ